MTPLSPSELVYLHADRFVKPRSSAIGNTATVMSTQRNINRRLMVTAILKTAIIANLTMDLLEYQSQPLEAARASRAQLEHSGAVGGFVSKLLSARFNAPQPHLLRVKTPSPWPAGSLESLIFETHDEGVAQPVQDTIPHAFGRVDPDADVIRALRRTLELRGVIERRKRLFGETWTLNTGHVSPAQLESVAQMHAGFSRAQPEAWSQLERAVEFGLSHADA